MDEGMLRFDDRAILVTGAGRGLGRAHAMLLASRGAKVLVADNGAAMDGGGGADGPAQEVVAAISAAGGTAVAYTADLSQEKGSHGAVAATLDAFGRIDGILHNASTVPELMPPDLLSTADLDSVLRVNVYAALWMVRTAWPHFVANRHGRIVLTSSAGIFGAEGNMSYCAAKAAVLGIMRCLAVEGRAHGIHVNVIAPSASTRMTERFLADDYARWFHQAMPPEQVAAAAAWLLHEACGVNGEILALGGGRIGRIVLGENDGVLHAGRSIEDAAKALPQVLQEGSFFYPASLAERSARVMGMFAAPGG